MNNTIEELFARKSVRVFADKLIEPEKKQLIIDAAIQAPTAGNMTLYSIIDVQSQELKDKLAKTCDNQPFIPPGGTGRHSSIAGVPDVRSMARTQVDLDFRKVIIRSHRRLREKQRDQTNQ